MWILIKSSSPIYVRNTVFNLITAHSPISAQSSNFLVSRLQSVYFYLLFLKAHVVGTHLNCLDLSRQFKWVSITFAFRHSLEKIPHKHPKNYSLKKYSAIFISLMSALLHCRWLLSHLLVAGCDIGVRFSVRPSVRPSVRLSTFMSTFDIYVKVSILINYKTKQPSNLAWNISLTSWLCDIGVRFSVCLSIRPSVCQHLCRSSTFMSKLVF